MKKVKGILILLALSLPILVSGQIRAPFGLIATDSIRVEGDVSLTGEFRWHEDTKLQGNSTVMVVTAGGAQSFGFYSDRAVTYHVRPQLTSSYDLGTTSLYYNKLYVNTVYLKDANTYITRDASNNMTFTDFNAGSGIKLSQLRNFTGIEDYTASAIGYTHSVVPSLETKYIHVDDTLEASGGASDGTRNITMTNLELDDEDYTVFVRSHLDNNSGNGSTQYIYYKDSDSDTFLTQTCNDGDEKTWGACLMWDSTNELWVVISNYEN